MRMAPAADEGESGCGDAVEAVKGEDVCCGEAKAAEGGGGLKLGSPAGFEKGERVRKLRLHRSKAIYLQAEGSELLIVGVWAKRADEARNKRRLPLLGCRSEGYLALEGAKAALFRGQ